MRPRFSAVPSAPLGLLQFHVYSLSASCGLAKSVTESRLLFFSHCKPVCVSVTVAVSVVHEAHPRQRCAFGMALLGSKMLSMRASTYTASPVVRQALPWSIALCSTMLNFVAIVVVQTT